MNLFDYFREEIQVHTIYSKKFLTLIALSSLLTLTACGGGGGGSSGVTTVQANAREAAQIYIASVNTQNMLITLTMEEVPYLVSAGKTSARDTGVNSCSLGGSTTLRFSDNDRNSSVSTGDTYTTTYNNCNDGNGTVYVSGNISGTITAANGTLPDFLYAGNPFGASNWSVQQNMTFTNFVTRNSSSSETSTINGSATVNVSYDANRITYNSSLTTNRLQSTDTFAGQQTQFIYNPSNFAYSQNVSGAYSIDHDVSMSFSMDNQVINLTYTTAPPFGGNTDSEPTTGQVLVQGAGQPTMRVTALANGLFALLETDNNNDGIFESSEQAYWGSLGF